MQSAYQSIQTAHETHSRQSPRFPSRHKLQGSDGGRQIDGSLSAQVSAAATTTHGHKPRHQGIRGKSERIHDISNHQLLHGIFEEQIADAEGYR